MKLTRDYHVHMPPDRWVKAACEDVGCTEWREGWASVIDESTDCHGDPRLLCAWARAGNRACGACQARYIRFKSGRTFTEVKGPNGVTVFKFESGQRCFAEHRTRPARLTVDAGGRVLRAHSSLAGLAEDYTEHCGNLAAQFERG